jgi:hypothetical protein
MKGPLVIKVEDLPISIVLVGKDGREAEAYQLMPASRKFGASLQKCVGMARELILRFIERK